MECDFDLGMGLRNGVFSLTQFFSFLVLGFMGLIYFSPFIGPKMAAVGLAPLVGLFSSISKLNPGKILFFFFGKAFLHQLAVFNMK